MENLVLFRSNQQILTDDLNNIETYARQTFDDLVANCIDPGQKYAGLAVTQAGPTAVNVAPGLYFSGGAMFTSPVQTNLSMVQHLPVVQQIIATIVAWGLPDQESNIQSRKYIINADTGAFQVSNVTMESTRAAQLSVIYGPESANPQRGTIGAGVIAICDVLLNPSGIVSITMDPTTQIGSVSDAESKLSALALWQVSIGQQIATLRTELAVLAGLIPLNLAQILAGLAQAIDQLRTLINKLASAFFTALENFDNANNANTGGAGYAAIVSDGLRFPFASRALTQLALLNPLEPALALIGGGNQYAPVYNQIVRFSLVPAGSKQLTGAQYASGEMSIGPASSTITITSYGYITAVYTVRYLRKKVIRYGANVYSPISNPPQSNLTRYVTGSNVVANQSSTQGLAEISRRPALDFYQQAAVSGDATAANWPYFWQNSDPKKLVSDRKQWVWTDYYDAAVWDAYTYQQTNAGSRIAITFVPSSSGWLTGIKLFWSSAPASGGTNYIFVCECDSAGRPDTTKVLTLDTILAANLTTGQNGYVTRLSCFLQAGKRYAFIYQSTNAYQLFTTNAADASALGFPSVYAWYTDGAPSWQPLANVPYFQILMAQFQNNISVVNFQPGILAAGMDCFRLMLPQYEPPGTTLTWEVQIGGAWSPLSNASPNIFGTKPNLVPIRAIFTGTAEVQPVISLGLSELDCGQMAQSLTYKENAYPPLAQNTTSIKLTIYITQWDPANHTVTGKVWVSGTSYTPTATADTPTPNDPTKLQRILSFTVPSTNTFSWDVIATTNGTNGFPLVTDVWASAF